MNHETKPITIEPEVVSNRWGYKTLLVIGEVCVDIFCYGEVKRLSPEAPIPILSNIEEVESLGMARNVYENIQSLIRKNKSPLIRTCSIIESEYSSSKTRYVDKKTNHYFLRVDNEGYYPPITFNDGVRKLINDVDFILISDYDKGFLTYQDIEFISKLAKDEASIFIDTKKLIIKELLNNVDFVKCNYSEYEKIPKEVYDEHKNKIIVTCGDGGAKHNDIVYETTPITTMDVSGAGDTFFASLVYKYSENYDMGDSIRFANEMSNIVVQKKGVSVI